MTRRKIIIICLLLFAFSAAVRFIVWQNNKVEMSGVQWVLTQIYKNDASHLVRGDIKTFLTGPNPPSDANILLHPPGYSIFIAAVWSIFGENNSFLIAQILINSLAPVVIFAIALRLFELRTAVMAGLFAAFSPQIVYHSGLMLPDELSVIPILVALYSVVLARKNGSIKYAIVAGFAIGVSCWFRSNAMLLPVFFAIAAVLLFPRALGFRFAGTLIVAFMLTIAPITLRNYVVFGAFVPLSLGMGTTFLEGLGDYDTDGRLGMPKLDEDVMRMDVARSSRLDYYGYLYAPDGIERERARVKDGLAVVAANPAWYAKAVAHRASTSFRMERVPAIATERDERETTPAALYYLNKPLKLLQKIFITGVILPLFLFGLIVPAWLKRARRELLLLAIIPAYYMSVQSLLHTEYRYLLPMTHVVLIFVAVGINYLFGKFIRRPTERDEESQGPEMSPV